MLELPPGPYTLTVSAWPLYVPVTQSVTVPQSNLLRQDFSLTPALLTYLPVVFK